MLNASKLIKHIDNLFALLEANEELIIDYWVCSLLECSSLNS